MSIQQKSIISKKLSFKNVLPLPTINLNEYIEVAFDNYYKTQLKSKEPKFASLYRVSV